MSTKREENLAILREIESLLPELETVSDAEYRQTVAHMILKMMEVQTEQAYAIEILLAKIENLNAKTDRLLHEVARLGAGK